MARNGGDLHAAGARDANALGSMESVVPPAAPADPPGDAPALFEAADRPLRGRTIAFLEARRATELAAMIARAGGVAYAAPMLREVPIEDDGEIRGWLQRLIVREFAVVIFLTGGGCQMLLERAERDGCLPAVLDALANTRVVARGPKPARVLKQRAIDIAYVAPEPNTSAELLAELGRWDLTGQTIGLQLYGGVTPTLLRLRDGVNALGARVCEVAPYRWEGPTDRRPVRDLIDACLGGRIDALAVLSSSQIHGLFEIASEHEQGAALRDALNSPRVLIAAVGPVTAEAIEAHGVHVDLQPEHPKMGHLLNLLGSALSTRS